MSILAYVGLPGSGKSYNVVEQVILPALKQGRRVVTNVPLYVDKVREVALSGEIVEFPVQAVSQDPDSIKQYVTNGCVFVLDEVWRLWPQGQKADEVPEAFKSLLAEHRHMVDSEGNSVSITFVVQDLANIGAFARRLVEQTVIHTKLGHVGSSKRFRVDIYQGQVTGITGPQKKRLREVYGKYKPEVFMLYKSHTMSEAGADGANEKHVDTRGNVLKKPALIVGALAVPCLIAYGVYGLSKFVHSNKASEQVSSAPHASQVQAVSQSPINQLKFPVKENEQQSQVTWRVVGWVINNAHPEKSKALLRGNDGHPQNVDFEQCRSIEGQPLRCLLEGYWYSETGKTWPAGDSKFAMPLGANGVSTG